MYPVLRNEGSESVRSFGVDIIHIIAVILKVATAYLRGQRIRLSKHTLLKGGKNTQVGNLETQQGPFLETPSLHF